MAFLSPEPGSGKSRALEVTDLLVPRPVQTVNTSPAYIFRKVADEAGPPTIGRTCRRCWTRNRQRYAEQPA
jgi:hypothetical protein